MRRADRRRSQSPRPEAPGQPDHAAGPAGSPSPVHRTRLGGLWVVAVLGAIMLVLLLVFILQNGQRVEVHLFGAHWTAPLGVALLMAAALGVLLVVVPGAGRIIQLKRAARGLHRDREQLAGRLDEIAGAAAPGDDQAPPAQPDAGNDVPEGHGRATAAPQSDADPAAEPRRARASDGH
jgi:uncharacterized integral membrane protein